MITIRSTDVIRWAGSLAREENRALYRLWPLFDVFDFDGMRLVVTKVVLVAEDLTDMRRLTGATSIYSKINLLMGRSEGAA